jgi:hypothetical protein
MTYLIKVILETSRIWLRLFQKRDTFIRQATFLEWSSSNTSRFWNNLHQMRHVSWMTFIRHLTFLDWNNLHQIRHASGRRDVFDEGHSRKVTYLMKVIPETWRIWWRLFQKRDVSDEGYSRNVPYLMKVIPERSRFWNNLHQIRNVSGITFIRYVSFLNDLHQIRIWWRLFQKRDVFD